MERTLNLVITTLLLWSSSALASEPPSVVVRELYGRFINIAPEDYGKPYFRRVDDLVGPKLLSVLEAQETYQEACVRAAPPNTKPHMIDQNPFLFAPDGVKEILSVVEIVSEKRAKVVVRLGYEGVDWVDTVELEKQNENWLISNIYWGEGGSLKERLESFMSYPCGA